MSADETLLIELLAAWRATRDAELEPLIDRVGSQLARRRGPLAFPARQLEPAWLEIARARDPADVDRLFDASWPKGESLLRARVAALAAFDPDPRITRALGTLAPRFTYQQYQPLQKELAAVMMRAPTEAIPTAMRALDKSAFVSFYGGALRAYNALVRTAADPALIARAKEAAPIAGDLETLWARHFEDPGDLENRAVLADALTSVGDPRGEFITAQLAISAGRGTAALVKRAAELSSAHLVTWLGAVPYYDKADVVFERGFPVYVRCATSTGRIIQSAGAPEWSTVERLEITPWDDHDLTPLVTRLPHLRRLMTSARMLEQLAASGPHPAIRVLAVDRGTWWPSRVAFPNLAVLCGDGWSAEAAQAAAELGVILVHTSMGPEGVAPVVAMRAAGPPEVRMVFGGGPLRPWSWCVRVRRDDAVADVSWLGTKVGRDHDDVGAAILEALAGTDLASVRLFTPPRTKKFPKVEAVARKLALTRGTEFDVSAPP